MIKEILRNWKVAYRLIEFLIYLAIINSGGLSKEDTVDLLDGLDLDFLTFGKGGVFQNLDDADFSFDDIGGFRLRGMSEVGLGLPEAATQQSSDQRATKHIEQNGNQNKSNHGIQNRDYRSGSLGWFDSNTFLNERDPFLMKNYATTDFSLTSLATTQLEDRSQRHNSFDAVVPSSPVNIYASEGHEEKNSSAASSQNSGGRYTSSAKNSAIDPSYNMMANPDLSSMGLGYNLPIGMPCFTPTLISS